MSYLQRIAECNQYDSTHYLAFEIQGEQLGWTSQYFAEALSQYPDIFNITDTVVTFQKNLNTTEKISEAAAIVFAELHKKGVIDTWVDEIYPVVMNFGEKARMHVERAATTYLGIKSFGVHANGLVKKSDGIYIWIGTRTQAKPFWPGKLDQMVAGGQPAGISLLDNLIKEAAEEANIPQPIAEKAEYITSLSYCSEGDRGINPDTLFVYDLWLPETFIPENTDGEVESFQLVSLEQLASLVESTTDFKENCNLVNIDLLLRHQVIDSNHQDYSEIQNKLYSPAVKLFSEG